MSFPQFDRVPNHYAGKIIQRLKEFRLDEGRRSLWPTRLSIGELEILLPRHFGFCFGVERAIHMAFAALEEHSDRRIHLVSEIIHNQLVNGDLQQRGINFLFESNGEKTRMHREIPSADIVLIPAFGTTLQIEKAIQASGIDTAAEEFRQQYDTTCPFVSKVWNRGEQLGREGYTILIHGKLGHEETRATQSHIQRHTRTLVVRDRREARRVGEFIAGAMSAAAFRAEFGDKCSEGFDPEKDLERIGVVNQTTMLAEETQEVADILQEAMRRRYGERSLGHHFADTRDTLCYATNQNQNATRKLLEARPDLAVIVGGYNSSNTSHLVEICSQRLPGYLVRDSGELLSRRRIRHFDIHTKKLICSENWLPSRPSRLAVTSGASCPDILMDQVVEKIAGFYGYGAAEIEAGLDRLSICTGESVPA